MNDINTKVIQELAVATAFLQLGYHNEFDFDEMDEDSIELMFENIITQAQTNLERTGIAGKIKNSAVYRVLFATGNFYFTGKEDLD